MSFETILWDVDDGIGTLTINRPEQFNGMTNTMLRETHELLHDVADDDSVTVIVLTGAGKAFCPGADLKHYTSGAKSEPNKDEYFDVPVLLHEMPQVTVAAINGACAGAGLGWACGCDLRYAARSAKLNTAFLDVAVAGDMGLPWTLPRLVGAGAERLARAGEHDHGHGVVVGDIVQQLVGLPQHSVGHPVELLGTVDGDRADPPVLLPEDGLELAGHGWPPLLSRSTVAMNSATVSAMMSATGRTSSMRPAT